MKKAQGSRRGNSRSTKAGLMLAAAAASFVFSRSASAVTGTWLDTSGDSNWSDGTNWSTNPTPPGNDTGSTTNGDTAWFTNSTAVAGSSTVNLDVANWNILNITFDSSSANSFTIGTTAAGANSLLLSSGGEVLEDSSVSSPAAELINAPVVLEGNATFENDASTSASGLKFNGNISGGTSGPITLTLQGTNTGSTSSSNDQIIGAISNGSSSALSIVKNGTGIWQLSSTGTSTYTGTTTVEQGNLIVTTGGGISAATDVTVDQGATFNSNTSTGPFPTIHSLTVETAASSTNVLATGATNAFINIANNVGPALVINSQGDGIAGITPVSLNFDLTGTGGIVSIVNSAFNNHYTFEGTGKILDLGTTSHLLYQNYGGSSTDLQINGTVSSDSSGGGVIKSGNGTVKLQVTAPAVETFTGPIEIQEGSFKLTGTEENQLPGVNPLLIDGGNFNPDGTATGTGDVTVASFNATSGSITEGSGGAAARIYAPSYNFNIVTGENFPVGSSLGDFSGGTVNGGSGTGTSAVNIAGPGTVTFSGTANSYSAGTTVSGATLVANMNASGSPLSTGAVALNGSSLNLDPNAAAGSGSAISYTLATAASTQLTYGGGDMLGIKQGNETSFTVTIGNGSGSALNRVNNGTLVIAPDLGTSSLGIGGGTEFLFVAGTAPTLTNGIVNTSIVGQNNDSNASGDFLTYSAGNGFSLAAYSSSTNINTAGSSAIYNAGTGGNTNALSGSASVYALNAEAQTIDTHGNILTVGNGSGQAGVILNGGVIEDSTAGAGTLAFGAAEGTIFTSKAGGTISSIISGSGGVTAFGPGKLSLTGNNTFTGGLNINQGTVNVSTDPNLGAAGGSITFGGGTLQFASSFPTTVTRPITINAGNGTIDPQSGTITISSAISGAGNLTVNSTGTAGKLILSNANTYGGTTISAASTLQLNTGGSLGSGSVINNGGLIFNASGSPSVSAVISGLGSITQSGTGTAALSGSNSYAGATAINSGGIQVGNANALGFGGASTGASLPVATVNSSATLDLNGQQLNKPITLNGGTLTNSSATVAGLSTGVNGYVVTSPGVGVAADLVTVTGGGSGVTAGATVKLLLGLTNASITSVTGGSGYATAPTVTINPGYGGGSGATAVATVSGGAVTAVTITNPGVGYYQIPSFSFSGGGGSGASVTANTDNFIAVGAQAISPGSGYTSVPTATPYDIESSAGVSTETLPTLTAVLNTVNFQATSNIGGNNGDISLANLVSGGGGLTKIGSDTLTLSAANTYSGGTIVNAGTLNVSNTSGSATGTNSVTLNGGTLASGPVGAISGNVLAGSGAHTIAPGGIGSIGTLSLGGLTTSSLSTLNFDLGTGAGPEITNGDLLTLGSGTVSIGSGTLLSFGGTPVVGDDYRLIGGSISGITLANFAGLSSGESLSKTVDPGFIDLVVAAGGPADLTWDDASGNNLWDNGTSVNWNNGSSNTTFSTGSNVTFSDNNGSAAGRYSVTLNSTVLPASMVVNNSTGSYSITGTGTIGGTGSLTKSGTGTLTLATANTYTGGTNVSAGLLLIEPTSSTTSALANGALSITGGKVQLATNVTQGSQSANPPSTAPTSNVKISSLSIAGTGTLDIGNNHLIINYGSSADPIASIASLIADGAYGSGTTVTWTGTGITSSAAASNPSYGIGYADSNDPGNPAGLASGQIEIMYTLLGDANLDGKVNGSDFNLMATNFNQAVTAGWDKGDFNYDGKVNGNDFVLLAANFNQFASQSAVSSADETALDAFAAANGISLNSVPEPASMGLLTLGLVGVMARRRRRSSK